MLTAEDFCDCLEFRIIKGVARGVYIDTQSIDGSLVTSVKGRGGVGRIGNERVHGVCHLVSQHRELVQCHLRLIFAVDAAMGNETCRSDHVGCHAVSNEHDDVLRAPLGREITNKPVSDCLLFPVIGQSGLVFAGLIKSDSPVDL